MRKKRTGDYFVWGPRDEIIIPYSTIEWINGFSLALSSKYQEYIGAFTSWRQMEKWIFENPDLCVKTNLGPLTKATDVELVEYWLEEKDRYLTWLDRQSKNHLFKT